MELLKYMSNDKIKSIIVENIIKKCQSICEREINRGEKILKDEYFSIKDIERVLKDLSE
jgi:hypothetical protein